MAPHMAVCLDETPLEVPYRHHEAPPQLREIQRLLGQGFACQTANTDDKVLTARSLIRMCAKMIPKRFWAYHSGKIVRTDGRTK